MKTALVTGCAGFLGRYIVSGLRAAGWRVAGIGRGAVGIGRMLDVAYETSLPDAALDMAVRKERPILCVHAASPSSVPESVADPEFDFKYALLPWVQLLDSLRRHVPDCRTILLSSAAVYGQPDALPVGEAVKCRPISPYGFHRMYCEQLLDEYRLLYGMKGTSLRIFSAYGEGLHRQVVWDICTKALAGNKDIVLLGTGTETRDFVHAEDVAMAVCQVAQQVDWHNVYNVASGTEVAIRQLAEQILSIIPGSPTLHFDGRASLGMPIRWRADITRMRELGYEPTRRWQEGVHEVVAACLREVART